MHLSPDQKSCLISLFEWYKNRTQPSLTLGGYAGVGKTTLLSTFRKLIYTHNPKIHVGFCSFTGRATRVLHQRLKEGDALLPKDGVSTIHSMIYSPILDEHHHISGWKLKDALKFDLIVVDEASMIGRSLWEHLSGFGIPILAVGDHGQLPPIDSDFNLMKNPQLRLEKIHRQAQDNPIIQVSLLARENGYIPARTFGEGVIKYDRADADTGDTVESILRRYSSDCLVLCGYNKTRINLNSFIREHRGLESREPTKGDRVICLKNNHKKSIFNGMLGTIASISPKTLDWYTSEIVMDDESYPFSGQVYKHQFGNQEQIFSRQPSLIKQGDFFDFGYALTVHKSQGSQAKKVILFEERFSQMDDDMWRRWLYTAVTRAEEELFIVGTTLKSS